MITSLTRVEIYNVAGGFENNTTMCHPALWGTIGRVPACQTMAHAASVFMKGTLNIDIVNNVAFSSTFVVCEWTQLWSCFCWQQFTVSLAATMIVSGLFVLHLRLGQGITRGRRAGLQGVIKEVLKTQV
jgi:hypothetical protein